MTKRNRRLERMACDVFDAAMQHRRPTETVDMPTDAWLECDRIAKLLRKAQSRSWFNAATKLRQQLPVALNSFAVRFATVQRTLSEPQPPHTRATIADIYDELAAIEEEFGGVGYCRSSNELSVTTEEIVLEDMNFGPFEIVLRWGQFDTAEEYRVVAIEPHPASSDESTTHPHVQNDAICEGDALVLIQRALHDLRLSDFFMIVRQILRNYNSSSPFVSIDDWNGIHCHDCGDTVNREDCDACHACEVNLCCGCSCGCTNCDDRYCNNCTIVCEACLECCCQMCSVNCDQCNLLTCKDCLNNEKCPSCVEKETEEAIPTENADATVHAICVGKVTVAS